MTSHAAPHDWDEINLGLCRALLTLAETTRSMQDATLEQIAGEVVKEARCLLGEIECVLAVVEEERPDVFTVIAGAGKWAEEKVGGTWPLEGTLNGRALTTQQIVETEDAENESATPEVFDHQIRFGRLVPILGSEPLPDGRNVLGVLGFWRSQGPFTNTERKIVDAFAAHASLHLIGHEARRASSTISDRLEFAQRVSLDLQSSLNPRDVVGRLLNTTASVVRADRLTLSTIEDEVITIEATLGHGGEPTWVGRSYGDEFLRVQPEVGRAVRDMSPVLGGKLNVAEAAPEFREALERVSHTLTLPLVTSDQVVGLLVLSRIEDVPFTASDVAILQLVGGISALALRNARQFQRVEEAERVKGDFINMAAHELRTPVTVVQGYLELIRRGAFGELPDELSKRLEVVAVKSEELGALVGNILDAAKSPSTAPVMPRSVFDLRDEVRYAVARAEGLRSLLDGKLQVEVPDEPVVVEVSPGYLSRIIDNLINNALTYQAEKPWVGITLTVNDRTALVSVTDHGYGIPAEVQPQVFEQFFRIDEPPWNQVAGAGLGLYLSKQYAAATGGELVLQEFVLGEKTVFCLSLPLA